MDRIYVEKEQTLPEGHFYALDASYRTFHSSVQVVDKRTDTVLAVFLKGAISDPKILVAGQKLVKYGGSTGFRVNAGGFGKQQRKGEGPSVTRRVPSTIVGFAAASNALPCRTTALYKKHEAFFKASTFALVKNISDIFKMTCPEIWNIQKAFVDRVHPSMVIDDTVFTTLTVNRNFRTAAHRDRGDFHSGLGNLAVFQDPRHPEYTGGELLLPEYRIAFDVRQGDLLFVDVHQLHANNVISGKGRISLVCYAMEKIVQCQVPP